VLKSWRMCRRAAQAPRMGRQPAVS
jgi:hypothetical protein